MPQSLQLTSYVYPEEKWSSQVDHHYQQLNNQTVKSCWPSPSVEETFGKKLLLLNYRHVMVFPSAPFRNEYSRLNSFQYSVWSLQKLVLPKGIYGCPNVFQSLLENVLVGFKWKSTIPYLDDCVLFSRSAVNHNE